MKVTSLILLACQLAAGVYASSSNSYGAYGSNFFVDTQNSYYDGYQQAWRYLGWYVKCGAPSDRYDEEESQHSGSQDNEDSDDGRWEGNNYCQRFLIWAAYIDENYQGGGIGEYHYYDPYSSSWDFSACSAHGNGRCAPMDCHITNTTTWTLMGVFKEASYFGNDAFFEQLFKHEGVCVWNDDDLYEFMSEARENSWTQGCVSTGVKGNSYYFSNNNGDDGYNYIYIDLKPTWNGNMTYGLYTDSVCKIEYEGMDADVDKIAANMGLLYDDYLRTWNDGLEIYKVCQPCMAYNLKNDYSSNNYRSRGLGDNDYSYQYDDPNEGYFQCDDDADYTNVNQCMKFRSHADLEVATWEDLVTATNQGGILPIKVGGTVFGSDRMSAEEYEYLQHQRKSTIAKDAKKAKQQAARVAAMRPGAERWETAGGIMVAAGALALTAVLVRLCKLYYDHSKERTLEEPLLVPIEHIEQIENSIREYVGQARS